MLHDDPAATAEIGGVRVEEILALEGLDGAAATTAYLAGSLVEGSGNSWSDVDVFVIGERRPIGPLALYPGPNHVSQHYLGDRRVDFEFWPPSHVEDLGRRLRELELEVGNWVVRTVFSHIEECFLDRLRRGRPILDEERFRRFQGLFDFDRFRRYQTQEVIRQLDECLGDLCGMIEDGDHDVALFVAREVVGKTVDAWCHSRGNTDPNTKWRLRHLASVDDGDPRHRRLVEEFWRLQFPEAALREDPATRRAYLEECVHFANRTVSWIQGC